MNKNNKNSFNFSLFPTILSLAFLPALVCLSLPVNAAAKVRDKVKDKAPTSMNRAAPAKQKAGKNAGALVQLPPSSKVFVGDDSKKAESLPLKSYEAQTLSMVNQMLDYYSSNAGIYSDARLFNFNVYEKTDGITRSTYNLSGKYCEVNINFTPTAHPPSTSPSLVQLEYEYSVLKEILRCSETVRNLANDLPDLYQNEVARGNSPETYKIINKFMNVGLAARSFAIYYGFNPFSRYLENKISSEALLLISKRYSEEEAKSFTSYMHEKSTKENAQVNFEFININYAWDDSYAINAVYNYLNEKSSFIIIKNATNEDIHQSAQAIGQGALEAVLSHDNFKAWALSPDQRGLIVKPDWVAPPPVSYSLTSLLTEQRVRGESLMEKAIVEKTAQLSLEKSDTINDTVSGGASSLDSSSEDNANVSSSEKAAIDELSPSAQAVKNIINAHPPYSSASPIRIYNKDYIAKVRKSIE